MTAARNQALATQARRVYLEALVRGMTPLCAAISVGARNLLVQGAPHAVMMARRDAIQAWHKLGPSWQITVVKALRHAAEHGVNEAPREQDASPAPGASKMSLVDDVTIEREITGSRLALVMMDRATWEFTDLRTRMQTLEAHDDLAPLDLLRAHVVARVALDAWTRVGLGAPVWQLLQHELHEEFAQLLSEAYHEVNRWLIAQKVLPEVDLRPFIRRSPQAATAAAATATGGAEASAGPAPAGGGAAAVAGAPAGAAAASAAVGAMAAGASTLSKASAQAEEVMAQLQRVLARHVPGFPVATRQLPAQPGTGRPSLAEAPGAAGDGTAAPAARR